ncbi:leucine-rich repeat domain-containing protein [Weissella cibaria]|nr:leucine-rich repeat domain-containing protein [Weissella cibaria]MCT0956297.1 leucine-rich repeat domain-containing protein [Weissella cibaria]
MVNVRLNKRRLRAVVAFLTLIGLGFGGVVGYEATMAQPNQVVRADTASTTLLQLGIPKAVIQTMLDNSLESDGRTPTAAGGTVNTFTVGDVQKLKTLSLATRTKNADGTYTSKANSNVADWLGSLDYTATTGGASPVVTNDVVLGADYLSTGQTAASTILDKGVPKWSGGDQYYTPTPILNVLMAVINSATNATTLDLTGMLSKVPTQSAYSTVHMATMALVQTNKLTNLKTLNLGGNRLGSDQQGAAAIDGSAYYLFRSNTLTSNSVTDLDLSNNDFTTLDGNILSGIGSQISALNLGGNNITSIDYNNGSVFSNASKSDGGSVNLAGSENLNVSGNTAYVIASALNSGGASLTLDDKTANDLATNQLASQSAWPGVSSAGFQSIAPQLSGSTVTTIVS